MAQTTLSQPSALTRPVHPGRFKFLIGGLAVIGAIVLLVVNTLPSTMQYYYTVDELYAKGSAVTGQNIRASGAVLGDSITYDPTTLEITFEMVHVPGDMAAAEKAGGLAQLLHQAVTTPGAQKIRVHYVGPKPDLLRREAQAIVTGRLGDDGVFYADELLLKCPTRYEDVPGHPPSATGG